MTSPMTFLTDDIQRQLSLARNMADELQRIHNHPDPEVQAVKRGLIRLACQLAENANSTAARATAAIESAPYGHWV